jgi:hypothetical protein
MPRLASPVIALTIYSRPGCHLCDEMKAVVQRAPDRCRSRSKKSTSRATRARRRYGSEIPVLMVNGKKVAKYRITEEELTRMVMARSGGGLVWAGEDPTVPTLTPHLPHLPTRPAPYFAETTKWPRRFCCQQDSLLHCRTAVPCPC